MGKFAFKKDNTAFDTTIDPNNPGKIVAHGYLDKESFRNDLQNHPGYWQVKVSGRTQHVRKVSAGEKIGKSSPDNYYAKSQKSPLYPQGHMAGWFDTVTQEEGTPHLKYDYKH